MQIPGDVTKVRETAKQEARKNNLKVQPYIIIVGDLKKVSEVYVCLDDTLYVIDSVLKAIDVCFKSFFVFQLEYPFDSQHIWLLMQKGMYNISTKYDPILSFTEDIISKVKTNLKHVEKVLSESEILLSSNESNCESISNERISPIQRKRKRSKSSKTKTSKKKRIIEDSEESSD